MSADITTPIHVVHVTEAAAGGVRTHLRLIVPGLCARGIKVDLVIPATRPEPDVAADLAFYRELGCGVTSVPLERRARSVCSGVAARRLRRILQARDGCLLHTHAAVAGFTARLGRAGALPGVRWLHSPHAFWFQRFPCGWRRALAVRLERRLLRAPARLLLVSAAERDLARSVLRIPEARTRLAENGLPPALPGTLLSRAQARQALGIDSAVRAVVVPGRLAAQKGQERLLGALARLRTPADAAVHVYFCGSGPDEARLRRRCRTLDLGRRVTWLGYVPDLARHLPAFDLVLLPSHYEGLSYLLLEALAAGVPVLASQTPAHFPRPEMRRYIPALPLEDPEATAAAVREALHAQDISGAFRAWAPAFVRREFPLDAQIERLVACYRELVP